MVKNQNRKCISPVVATTLLLIVAVIAGVNLQSWFGTFSSSIFSKEIQNKNVEGNGKLSIEGLAGNILYVKNGVVNNLTINNLKISGKICNLTNQQNLTLGINFLNISSCLENLTTNTPNVVLITNTKVVDKQVYVKGVISSSPGNNSIFDIGPECRFKDNKTNCESYYETTTVDGYPVIHDIILGLYWQQSPHTTLLNWSNARINCSNLGSSWRLPTLVELETSLVDTERNTAPYIVGGTGEGLFEVLSNSYWTNTKIGPSTAYTVKFNSAYSYENSISSESYVFCVKEDNNYVNIWKNIQNFSYVDGIGQERLANQFTVNSSICGGDGTMYDTITNLCWEKSPSGSFNHSTAQTHCSNLTIADGNWRLPDKAELLTLLFHNGVFVTADKLNSIGFSNINGDYYWVNTFLIGSSSNAYYIAFNWGYSYHRHISNNNYVICVKAPV